MFHRKYMHAILLKLLHLTCGRMKQGLNRWQNHHFVLFFLPLVWFNSYVFGKILILVHIFIQKFNLRNHLSLKNYQIKNNSIVFWVLTTDNKIIGWHIVYWKGEAVYNIQGSLEASKSWRFYDTGRLALCLEREKESREENIILYLFLTNGILRIRIFKMYFSFDAGSTEG